MDKLGITVPWGTFTYINDALVWRHNPLLKKSKDEQYAENKINGYFNG